MLAYFLATKDKIYYKRCMVSTFVYCSDILQVFFEIIFLMRKRIRDNTVSD